MKTHRTTLLSAIAIFSILLLPLHIQAQGKWTAASINDFTPRTYPCAAVVDGVIFVIGGYSSILASGAQSTLEAYDPAVDRWITPDISGNLIARGGASASVIDDKIYVIGGSDVSANALSSMQVLDPIAATWSNPKTIGNFTARNRHSAAVMNGKIYIVGGAQQSTYITKVEVYDPVSNTWTAPPITGTFTPRRASAVAVVNNKMYVFGGFDGSQYLNTMEVFDPATNSWSTPKATGYPLARGGAVAGVVGGKILIMGGYNGVLPDVIEQFDPNTNTWTVLNTEGKFSTRSGAAAVSIENKIFVIGGAQADPLVGNNEYFTLTSSGVQEADAGEIHLTPNPTNGIISIRNIPATTLHLSVVNILGESVIEIDNPATPNYNINLRSSPCGVYIARFSTSSTTTTTMIIRD